MIQQEVDALRRDKYKLLFEVSSVHAKNIQSYTHILELKDEIKTLNKHVASYKRKYDELSCKTIEELTRAYTEPVSYEKKCEDTKEEKRVQLRKKEIQEVISNAILVNNVAQR